MIVVSRGSAPGREKHVELWRIHRVGEKPRRTWQEAVVRWMQETDTKGDHHKDIAKLRWFDQFLRNHHLDELDRAVVDQIARTKWLRQVHQRRTNI